MVLICSVVVLGLGSADFTPAFEIEMEDARRHYAESEGSTKRGVAFERLASFADLALKSEGYQWSRDKLVEMLGEPDRAVVEKGVEEYHYGYMTSDGQRFELVVTLRSDTVTQFGYKPPAHSSVIPGEVPGT
jgi:hypothetical protein